jgi:hypothetical protein
MTMVFHKKLVEVTQARIFLTGSPLTEFLKAKLKTCIEEDPRLDNFYLAYNTEVSWQITKQNKGWTFPPRLQHRGKPANNNEAKQRLDNFYLAYNTEV